MSTPSFPPKFTPLPMSISSLAPPPLHHTSTTPPNSNPTSPSRLYPRRSPSCGIAPPLIEIITQAEMLDSTSSPEKSPTLTIPDKTRPESEIRRPSCVKVSMVYNEYGELVRECDLYKRPASHDLNKTQILRVIKRAYHHAYRKRTGKIIVPQMDGKSPVLLAEGIWKDRASTWNFKPDEIPEPTPITETSPLMPVYRGPPHVLEIGCSDGSWCVNFKKELPGWIVEGIDDTAHWDCCDGSVVHGDFMKTPAGFPLDDYFSKVHITQETPEFTVRNINALIDHEESIPHNLYEFIRAREIFERVENYKTFLEHVRLILKPDGVVEFLEIDPRPRLLYNGQRASPGAHKSHAPTDWTDNIEDRFKDPFDEEFARDVPGWTTRVEERLNANLRPKDGVAAAKLKDWLEGAGFWDVKELVLPIPVGGHTASGQLLKEFIMYQVEIEDCIPKLQNTLPKIPTSALESGKYCLNLHIVTGRKPTIPRPGDLLMDGSRQEMTAAIYNAMERFDAIKSSQWQRFELEGKLPEMVKLISMPMIPGSFAGSVHMVTRGSPEDGLSPLVQKGEGRERQREKTEERGGGLLSPPLIDNDDSEKEGMKLGIESDGGSSKLYREEKERGRKREREKGNVIFSMECVEER